MLVLERTIGREGREEEKPTIPEPERRDRLAEVIDILSVPEEPQITTRGLTRPLSWRALRARDRNIILIEIRAWPLGDAELVDVDGGSVRS